MTDARFHRFKWRRLLLASSILVPLITPTALYAQGQLLGAIHGTVKDQQGGVLPGVTITATPTDNRPAVTVTTDAAGFYALKDLPPGDYRISAELPGFATLIQPDVLARAGLTLSLDLVMGLGSVGEVITVAREAPLLESSSATTAVNIRGELQRAIPLSYRSDWADFMLMTPGVIAGTDAVGFTNYSLHGADTGSQVLHVDGADMASVTRSTTGYVRLSTEAIDDVQIKTGGVDASAPLGVGAVVNVTTPTGSNHFAGAVRMDLQRADWNSNNTPGGTSRAIALFQPEAMLGGPVSRDRWWFFGSYRHTQQSVGINRTADQTATLRALAPDFSPFDDETTAHTSFGKVTGRLSTKHQVMGFAQYDVTPYDLSSQTYADKFRHAEQGGVAYATRLSSVWGSSSTSRLSVSYNNKAIPILGAHTDRPGRNIFRRVNLVSGRLVGADAVAVLDNLPGPSVEEEADKLTISADVTHFRRAWIGSHELQAGFYLQPLLRWRTALTYPNDGFVLEEAVLANASEPSAGVIPFHRQVYATTSVPSTFVDTHDYAVYLQDTWRPLSRLTLTAGVRMDWIEHRDAVFDVPTQDSFDVGPRLGINYLITADAHNTVRASWTRVHDTPAQTAVGASSSTAGSQDQYDLDRDGTFETIFTTPGATALARDRVFDPDNRHQPYVNEWNLGYRRQLSGQVGVDIGWLRRDFRERPGAVETNGIYEEGTFRGYRNPALNEIYLITNNIWNWPVYTGLELQVSKRSARLQLIGSYTRQWRRLAGSWQPNDPAAFLQPDAFANDRGIGNTRPTLAADANSLSGTQGRGSATADWHDHAVRLAASYRGVAGVVVATNYVYQSGLWSGPVVRLASSPDPSVGPPTLVLPNGRLVSNPLATTIRFVGADRSDGQFTLRPLHIWNVQVGRDSRVGATTVHTSVRVFNVTNHDTDQYPLAGSNQEYSPSFRQGTSRQLPRSVQLSVRFMF